MTRESTVPRDFLFKGTLAEVDPFVQQIVDREADRQTQKLIMIASESICPPAVSAALDSPFTNIYAEGYAPERMLEEDEDLLYDVEYQLSYHRRFGDRRYYKGTDYVNFVEALAQRRVATLFATDRDPNAGVKVAAKDIFANVQPLSGAPANNAVYSALLQPGDTIMGLNLAHGGHLTHGSPANRSGKWYKVVDYGIHPETGRIDYDELKRKARESNPKIIIAGASAYPWTIDWPRLREIATGLPKKPYLMADMAHVAGLIAGGVFPNPIGYVDVVTFTTHKTMIGPRAAVILTTSESLSRRIDRAVFPGEQGGPHVNTIAALAVSFKLAQRPEFRDLQRRIVENAQALAEGLKSRGLKLAYGGTNTHLLLVDLRPVETASGVPLNGDVVSRILDVCGIVSNKNTIAGDTSVIYPSGVRFGTTWLTQRGFRPAEMDRVAELIHRVITNIKTFSYPDADGDEPRGHIDYRVMHEVREGVRDLIARAAADRPKPAQPALSGALEVYGRQARAFLQEATTANVLALHPGESTRAELRDPDGEPLAAVTILRRPTDQHRRDRFVLAVETGRAGAVRDWLRALSDGYVEVSRADRYAKLEGPVAVVDTEVDDAERRALQAANGAAVDPSKPFFIGQPPSPAADRKQPFSFTPRDGEPRRTWLYDEHLKLGAQMVPFGGWLMPLRYGGTIAEEHQVVRQAAGLFDLTHMGVLEVSGPDAGRFLDLVTTNYVPWLGVGSAQYSFVLGPDGMTLDDILIYRLARDRYMLVVNAANAEKVEAWLRAVNDRSTIVDRDAPGHEVDANATIRNLKEPSAGADQRVDLAVQGPNSLAVLRAMTEDPALRRRLGQLKRFTFVSAQLGGIPVLVARTGYTGERYGYELYVHPDRASALWQLLLEKGAAHGLRPVGLGARDSLRAEAGFPLYGHELAGPYDISPIGAGYGGFVKLNKPFFVGKQPLIAQEAKRSRTVIRFQAAARGGRMLRMGDTVVDPHGEAVGVVTTCVVVDGARLGLAYVDQRVAAEGTQLGVAVSSRVHGASAPEPIVVLPRFRRA